MTPQTHIESPAQRRAVLEATERAATAADQAYVHDAMSGVVWERRGFFQVLTRVGRPASPGSDID